MFQERLQSLLRPELPLAVRNVNPRCHRPDLGPKSPSSLTSRKSKLSWTLQQMFVLSTHGHVISGHSKAISLQSLPGLTSVSTLWVPLTATEENIVAQRSPVFTDMSSQNNGSMGLKREDKKNVKCTASKSL